MRYRRKEVTQVEITFSPYTGDTAQFDEKWKADLFVEIGNAHYEAFQLNQDWKVPLTRNLRDTVQDLAIDWGTDLEGCPRKTLGLKEAKLIVEEGLL